MTYGDLNYSTEQINNILQKADTLTVPTKVSELTNDSNYVTKEELGRINDILDSINGEVI